LRDLLLAPQLNTLFGPRKVFFILCSASSLFFVFAFFIVTAERDLTREMVVVVD
jgi:hypothetical protein